MNTSSFVEYASKLAAYEDKPLPAPKNCGTLHCEHRPKCFTNYLPHYDDSHKLSNIVVGNVEWNQDSSEYSEWSKKYGFLDNKPSYHNIGTNKTAELHLLIEIDSVNFVWVCGNSKESLAHAKFFLDANVKLTDANKSSYTPRKQRVEWTKKKYANYECKELQELPKGKHVLTVTNGGEKNLEVSHVITW